MGVHAAPGWWPRCSPANPAPAVFALGSAALLAAGYAVGLLWLVVLACAVMLLQIRNLYGLWVVLVLGGVVAAASWVLPPTMLSWVASLLVWVLLVAAPRSVLLLWRQRRHGRAHGSDVDQLAALTGLPAALWTAGFWLVTTGCLVAGAVLLID